MEIKQYDRVELNNGKIATIVEILKPDKDYIADIELQEDYDTLQIEHSDIKKII